jgi:hypothetical protein
MSYVLSVVNGSAMNVELNITAVTVFAFHVKRVVIVVMQQFAGFVRMIVLCVGIIFAETVSFIVRDVMPLSVCLVSMNQGTRGIWCTVIFVGRSHVIIASMNA